MFQERNIQQSKTLLEYDKIIIKQMLHSQHIPQCVSPTFATNFSHGSSRRTFEGGNLGSNKVCKLSSSCLALDRHILKTFFLCS